MDEQKDELVAMYTSPEGKEVNPIDYLHGVWTSDSIGAIWYKMLGYFILDNVPGFYPDIVSDEDCVTIEKEEAKQGIMMNSRTIKLVLGRDVFKKEFWMDSKSPIFIMDEKLHSAFREVLTTGRLIKGTLRLRATPIPSTNLQGQGDLIELKLVWLEAVEAPA